MTPFTAIYRKEFQENRWLLLTVFSVCVTMILYGCVENSYNSVLRWLENAKLLGLCIVGAAAALSYATETEQKTAAFLRRIPVPGLTLLRAKLAWIVTVTLAVFVPLFIGRHIALGYYMPYGASAATWMTAAMSMIAWGLFWSTVCRSTLMAVLTTWLTQLVMLLGLASLFPGTYEIPFFGNYYYFHGIGGFLDRFQMSKLLLPNLISSVVFAVALYRAANFLDISERKLERGGGAPVYDGAAKHGWLARLFGFETWGPFRALLWQSIRQSSTVLTFGLIVAIIFTGWNWFKGMEFVLMLSSGPMIDTYLYNTSGFLYIAGCLIALGFSSAVFAQDQDNGQYRVLAQHGVSPNLVWWSRFLPFLFVYSLPVPMIVRLCHLYTHHIDLRVPADFIVPVLLLYYMPLCFGTLYSIFFRDYIVNVFLVLISTAFMMPVIAGIFYGPGGFDSSPATVIILLGLLTASWQMTADWLREKPQWRRLARPGFTLLVAYVLAFVVFVFTSLV